MMSDDRFDKFTEGARKALTLAQEEAMRFNHSYIGTEHLLLGIVRESDDTAAKVLADLGVQLSRVRSAVEFVIGRVDSVNAPEVGLTPRGKTAIELAVAEARHLGHHYLGTEHLLLGLIREGEGIAVGVLESLGINLEKARAATCRVLGLPAPPGPSPVLWEYMDIQVGWPTQDAGGYVKWVNGKEDVRFGKNKTLVFNALRILGAEGWELVTVDNPSGHGTNDPHYILKRPTSMTSSAWLAWFAAEVATRILPTPESPVRRRRPWRTDGTPRTRSMPRRR